MKILLVIMIAMSVLACKTIDVKPDVEPSTTIVQIGKVFVEQYKYALETRVYYFRTELQIDYQRMGRDLFLIEGVKSVSPEFYTMTVKIAKSYKWNEVEPKILKILDKLSDYKRAEEKKDKTDGVRFNEALIKQAVESAAKETDRIFADRIQGYFLRWNTME